MWNKVLCELVGKDRVSGRDFITLILWVLLFGIMLSCVALMVGDIICNLFGIISVTLPIYNNSLYTLFVAFSVGCITMTMLVGLVLFTRHVIPLVLDKADDVTIAQCPSVKKKP